MESITHRYMCMDGDNEYAKMLVLKDYIPLSVYLL